MKTDSKGNLAWWWYHTRKVVPFRSLWAVRLCVLEFNALHLGLLLLGLHWINDTIRWKNVVQVKGNPIDGVAKTGARLMKQTIWRNRQFNVVPRAMQAIHYHGWNRKAILCHERKGNGERVWRRWKKGIGANPVWEAMQCDKKRAIRFDGTKQGNAIRKEQSDLIG
jgi:hypothetical protein